MNKMIRFSLKKSFDWDEELWNTQYYALSTIRIELNQSMDMMKELMNQMYNLKDRLYD